MATYLITLVIEGRRPILGRVDSGGVCLSPAGLAVAEVWREGARIRREVALDVFVVMPDHFHAIVMIDPTDAWQDPQPATRGFRLPPCSLGGLIAGFKRASTRRIRAILPVAYPIGRRVWQRNFHERILRTPHALATARRYVERNPAKATRRSAPSARCR